MVEVEAHEIGMPDEFVSLALMEETRESAEVKVGAFEGRPFGWWQRTQVSCRLCSNAAFDVVVCIHKRELPGWHLAADGLGEIGEADERRDCGASAAQWHEALRVDEGFHHFLFTVLRDSMKVMTSSNL